MKLKITREVKISLTVIGALVALVLLVNFLKGINLFKPACYYYVEFDNVNQLSKSAPVFVNGYSVGLVRDIFYDYNRPEHVIVELDVDKRLRIPVGSHAEIASNLLGTVDMFLVLNRSDEYLSVGDTIVGRVDKGLMGSVSKDLVPEIQNLIPKLDSVLTSLDILLSNPDIPRGLENIAQVTSNLKTTTNELNSLLANDITELAQTLNRAGGNIVEITDSLKMIDYAETFRQIDSTLLSVQQLTAKLNRSDNSMGLLLNDSSLYMNLNRTGENAAELLRDLKENPKRYVSFSLFGRKDKKRQ